MLAQERDEQAPEEPAPGAADDRSGVRLALGWFLLASAIVLFLALVLPEVGRAFGDSHDGRNNSTWGLASRALREEGFLGSDAGAKNQLGEIYAHHPPLIIAEAAATETLLGEDEASTRAPAVLSSVAALVLLFLLLRATGIDPLAAGAATILVPATGMFLTYGVLLDTPMVSLPVGLAVLLCWQRARTDRPVRPLIVALLGALAGLIGWQAAFITVVAAGAILVRPRDHVERRTFVVPVLVGLAVGVGLTLIWVVQARGGLSELTGVARSRSEGAEFGLVATVERQATWMRDLFGPLVWLIGGALVAMFDRRLRPLVAVLVVGIFGYAVVMQDGAANHDYWNFWAVVLVAVGAAWLFDHVLALSSLSMPARIAGVLALCAAVLIGGTDHEPRTAAFMAQRAQAGDVLEPLRADPPDTLGLVGEFASPTSWVSYYLDAEPVLIEHRSDLEELPADTVVLVSQSCSSGASGELCRAAWEDELEASATEIFVLATVADLRRV